MAIFKQTPPSKADKSSNKSKKSQFATRTLVPVLPASVLLTNQKRADFIAEMAKLTRFPRKLFDELYREAINNFAEFAQRLHAVKGAKYDILGGALDLSLERAKNGMEQYKNYLQSNGIYPKNLSMQQELWNYVIFSASLFYNCGLLSEHYQIKLYDEARDEIGDWLPAQCNMKERAAYYFCEKRMLINEDAILPLNLLIARRLIPAKGFEWICSQRASLETWLQLLSSDLDDEDGTKSLFMSLMLWVDNYLITGDVPGGGTPRPSKQYKIPMMHFKRSPAGSEGVKPAAGGEGVSAETGPDVAGGTELSGQFPNLGGEFLTWLRNGLASGLINYNTLGSMLQVVREGMIMRGDAIYGEFLAANKDKKYGEKYTIADVEKAFQELAVTDPGVDGTAKVKVQAGGDIKNLQNWTLIQNPETIFSEIKMDTQPYYQIYAATAIASHYQWYQTLAQQSAPTSTHKG